MIRRPVALYPRFPFTGARPVQTTLKTLLAADDTAGATLATATDAVTKLNADFARALADATDAQAKAKAAKDKSSQTIVAALAKAAPDGSSVGPFTRPDGSMFTLEKGGNDGWHEAPLISPDAAIDLPDEAPTGGTGPGDATPPPLPTDGGLLPGMPGANPADTQATDEAAPTGLNPDGTPKTDV